MFFCACIGCGVRCGGERIRGGHGWGGEVCQPSPTAVTPGLAAREPCAADAGNDSLPYVRRRRAEWGLDRCLRARPLPGARALLPSCAGHATAWFAVHQRQAGEEGAHRSEQTAYGRPLHATMPTSVQARRVQQTHNHSLSCLVFDFEELLPPWTALGKQTDVLQMPHKRQVDVTAMHLSSFPVGCVTAVLGQLPKPT